LSHHPTVVQIARIAHTFSQDPVALLCDDGDEFVTLLRIAATQVIERDDKAQQAEMRANSPRR
jgi:hypothetical protein